MNKNKPFIHLFKTPGGYYIYDVNTNIILKTTEAVYEYLKNGREEPVKDAVDEDSTASVERIVGKMKEDGYLLPDRLSEILHPFDKVYEHYVSSKLLMVTLQVTQQCNLRCEYCSYSGSYLNRTHSNKRMSIATAKKAIDFLVNNSQDTETISVGFYGGEPLLEFKLIRECIEYAEKMAEGKGIMFTATVNGTLLTDEIIEYFQEHNLRLLISLDGPQKIQDRNRKFASGGCGTFEKITGNLERLKNKFPEYFKRNISFNAVLDPRNEFSCINEFFTSYDIIKDSTARSSSVSDFYQKQELVGEDVFYQQWEYEAFKIFLYMLGRLDRQYASKFVYENYTNLKTQLSDNRNKGSRLEGPGCPGGPCIPGISRLFVDISGNLYPCERVSEESEVMKIGHVNTGIDVEKGRRLLNVAKTTEENCRNCWAFRYCFLCAASADNLTELDGKKRNSQCGRVRSYVNGLFKDYCTYREFGHTFNENETLMVSYE